MTISEKVKYSTTCSVQDPRLSTAAIRPRLADSRYNFGMKKPSLKAAMESAMIEPGIYVAVRELIEILNHHRRVLGKAEINLVDTPVPLKRTQRPSTTRKIAQAIQTRNINELMDARRGKLTPSQRKSNRRAFIQKVIN